MTAPLADDFSRYLRPHEMEEALRQLTREYPALATLEQIGASMEGRPLWALTVTNSGQAVPAEAVDGLFEPFRRLARDRTNQGGGAGLGLAIARSITQAHGGIIAARPGDDGGLRVDVHLPHVG